MSLNFGEIFTRAWQIIWKHKVLWIFGIFAGCASGNGGGSGGNSNFSGDADVFQSNGGDVPPVLQDFFFEIERFFNTITPEQIIIFVVGLFCVLFIISLLSMALGIMGEIGLLRGVLQVEGGAEKLTFGELWVASTPFFWRLLVLWIVPGFVFLVLLAIFIIPAILLVESTDGGSLLFLLPFFCIVLPLAFVIALFRWLATMTIVLEDLSIMDGLRRGWDVLRTHFGSMFLMGILLFVINAVIGLVIAIPLIIIFVPFIFGVALGGDILQFGLIAALVCFCLYLPVSIILGGIIQAFNYTAWGLAYLRLTGLVPPSSSDASALEYA